MQKFKKGILYFVDYIVLLFGNFLQIGIFLILFMFLSHNYHENFIALYVVFNCNKLSIQSNLDVLLTSLVIVLLLAFSRLFWVNWHKKQTKSGDHH